MCVFYLLFFEDTRSTAVPLVDGETHVENEHITRIQKRLGRWNLFSGKQSQ